MFVPTRNATFKQVFNTRQIEIIAFAMDIYDRKKVAEPEVSGEGAKEHVQDYHRRLARFAG